MSLRNGLVLCSIQKNLIFYIILSTSYYFYFFFSKCSLYSKKHCPKTKNQLIFLRYLKYFAQQSTTAKRNPFVRKWTPKLGEKKKRNGFCNCLKIFWGSTSSKHNRTNGRLSVIIILRPFFFHLYDRIFNKTQF